MHRKFFFRLSRCLRGRAGSTPTMRLRQLLSGGAARRGSSLPAHRCTSSLATKLPEVASAARRTRDARPDPSDRDDRGVAPSPLQAERARRGVRSPRSLIVRMARRGGARSASNTTAQRPPRPTPCSRAQGVIMRWHGAGECSCEILHEQPVTNFRGCVAAFRAPSR